MLLTNSLPTIWHQRVYVPSPWKFIKNVSHSRPRALQNFTMSQKGIKCLKEKVNGHSIIKSLPKNYEMLSLKIAVDTNLLIAYKFYHNLKAIFNYSQKKERGLGVNFTPSKKIGQWRQHPRVTAPHVVPGDCVTWITSAGHCSSNSVVCSHFFAPKTKELSSLCKPFVCT